MIAALALPVIAGGLTLISFTAEKNPEKTTQPRNHSSARNTNDDKIRKYESKIEAPKTTKEQDSKIQSTEKMMDEKAIQFVLPVGTADEKSLPEISSKAPQETEVDKLPEYVGGMEAMTKYLVANIHYPDAAVKAKTTGKVMVSFVVTKTGKVTKAAIKRGVSKELDDEALRVISSMPNWTPGEKDGQKVDAEMILPVSFQL